jgi:hypothetical protein
MLLGMAGVILTGLVQPHASCASESAGIKPSMITPQLLLQVDQLLATNSAQQVQHASLSMGSLVNQVDQGQDKRLDARDSVNEDHQNLAATAIPLPDAFAMSAVLLIILLIAWCLRRWRLAY